MRPVSSTSPNQNETCDAGADPPVLMSRLFGIDIRSLGLFRVVAGSIVLLDILSRARFLTAHYTDIGVAPRATLEAFLLTPTQWSLHMLSGSIGWQIFLFALTALAALAMIVGYRTRLAVFCTWFLVASMQIRNPVVNNSGDMLLRVLLFWSLFLPLGASFSIDAAVRPDSKPLPRRVSNLATFAILMQVCFVYWFTAVLKSDPVWRYDHTAVYYALSIEQFVTPLGKLMYPYPELMKGLTIFTIWLEFIGPALAFLPFWHAPLRLIAILLFFGLHAGFGTAMRLGFFPWISATSWLLFLPSEFWDGTFSRLRTPDRLMFRVYYDGECGFCKRLARVVKMFTLIPETHLEPAQSDAAVEKIMLEEHSWVVKDSQNRTWIKFEAFVVLCRHSPLLWWLAPALGTAPVAALGRRFYEFVASHRDRTGPIVRFLKPRPLLIGLPAPLNATAGLLLVYVFFLNVRTLDPEKYAGFMPEWTDPIGHLTTLRQDWDMFAPYPLTDDGWYVVAARLHNGNEVDIFRKGRPLDWQKPDWVVDDYSSQRWRKFHMNLVRRKYRPFRKPYAEYLCWSWNRDHDYDHQLDGLDMYFMEEITLPDYETRPIRPRLLYAHHNIPESSESGSSSSNEPGASIRPPAMDGWHSDPESPLEISSGKNSGAVTLQVQPNA